MISRRGLLVALTVMHAIFIRVWSITLILEHLFVLFYFYKVHGPTPSNFCFCWRLSRCPLWNTRGSCVSVANRIPWGTKALLIGTSLLFHGIHFVRLITFGCFYGGSAPSYWGILGHACLLCPCCFSSIFMSAFRSLPGTLVRISPSQANPLQQDIPMALQTNWSLVLESSFRQGVFTWTLH